MSCDFRIDPISDTVFILLRDNVTEHELVSLSRRLVECPDFQPSMKRLIEIKGSLEKISLQFLREQAVARIPKDSCPVAIVASGESYRKMCLYWWTRDQISPEIIRIFTDINDALIWLCQEDGFHFTPPSLDKTSVSLVE